MFTIDQVILIADKTLVSVPGEIVYQREWKGKRIFTTNAQPTEDMGTAISYGWLFFDSQNQPLILPHLWSDEDAHHAKNVIWPFIQSGCDDPL